MLIQALSITVKILSMASSGGLPFSGRLGNLVFFQVKGKTFVRTWPSEIKQTKATKTSARIFGRASAIGAVIRKQLLPALSLESDNRIQTRFATAIAKWLKAQESGIMKPESALSYIQGFQFTEGPSLYERWNPNWIVRNPAPGLLEMKLPGFIPAKSISAPAHTVSVICHIVAARCYMEKGKTAGEAVSAELKIEYNDKLVPAQTISLKFPTPRSGLVVTAVSLTYVILKSDYEHVLKSKRFQPAGIVSAMYL